MARPAAPKSLDHVALWVDARDAIADFAYAHLGMHEIERTDSFTLLGVDALEGKLTLFDAEGPREAGVLERIVLRVRDLDRAVAGLPDDVVMTREGETAAFTGPGGLSLGLVERDGLEYDLDHVVLGVPDPAAAGPVLERMGFDAGRGHDYAVAHRFVRLVPGEAPETDRPLLNHLALLVDSAADWLDAAAELGVEVTDEKDAPNTYAVFLRGPDSISIEYVEHKPEFALS